MAEETQATEAVRAAAQAARAAAPSLAAAPDSAIDAALGAMASALQDAAPAVLTANEQDMRAAEASGLPAGVRDRLRLDDARLKAMAAQLEILAGVEPEPASRKVRDLPGGLVLSERRRPVGVIGANFEARPNVVVDIASQLVKSRNAGVLRTGSAALRSAIALADEVIAPALAHAGLDPAAIQLVRVPGQAAAHALVREPKLIPLVILRGSGDSTRALAAEGAAHGVRTLAHADGGGVLYIHPSSEGVDASRLIASSLDRLGVCNRLNLLLLDQQLWDAWLPDIVEQLAGLGIKASLPPHDHALGYEWALDSAREATVTIAAATGPAAAAAIANDETSGLAAGIAAADPSAAEEFLTAYTGTGAFWNATTRLLDGFKLLEVPETGINLDAVPGPRGPVTFRDLSLRQFVVTPLSLVSGMPDKLWSFSSMMGNRLRSGGSVADTQHVVGDDFARVLAEAQGGSEDQFAVLWRDVNPALLRYLRVLAPENAEDIAAETWMHVIRGLPRFVGDEAAWRAWLFTTARRRLIDQARLRKRHPAEPLDEISAAEEPRTADTAQLALDNLATESAIALLSQLPTPQAEVIMLRVVAGLDTEAVASLLGKTPGNVRVTAHRGLKKLESMLRSAGVASRAGVTT